MRARLHHLRWLLTTGVRYAPISVRRASSRSFARALREAAVVSLDVFDTALYRRVPEPADVFEIVAHRLAQRGRTTLAPAAFRARRIAAESRARDLARAAGRDEISLDAIATQLARDEDLDATVLRDEELAVERAAIVGNPDVLALYRALRTAGRRVVFVSDTYFPAEFVRERLVAAGYDEPELFASSTYGVQKESGKLFVAAATALDVRPGDIAHLGDNVRPDVQRALAAGVRAFWYRRAVRASRRYRADTSLANRVIERMRALRDDASREAPDIRVLHALGHELVGPVFVGLTQWLIDGIRGDRPDVALFCARDGFHILDCYQRLGKDLDLPPARYLEVSRRALIFPSITTIDERALAVLGDNNATIPVAMYTRRLGLEATDFPEALAACGLRADDEITTREQRARVSALFVALEPAIVARAAVERPLLLQYLRTLGVLDARSALFFDIGWGGTLQQAMAEICSLEGVPLRLQGRYLSTDPRARRLPSSVGSVRGWFADAGRPREVQRLFDQAYWFMEIAFSAPHGSVLGYQRRADDTVMPIHDTYDPRTPNAWAAARMHDAARDFIGTWVELFDGPGPTIERETAIARFRRFAEHPTSAEAAIFGELIHVGGLGATEEVQAIARPPRGIATRLAHPRRVHHGYERSHWKRGYLRRVFGLLGDVPSFVRLQDKLHAADLRTQ